MSYVIYIYSIYYNKIKTRVYNKIKARLRPNKGSTVAKTKINGNAKSYELTKQQVIDQIY